MKNEYLILVNAKFPMCTAEPSDLASVSAAFPEIMLRQKAQTALQNLLLAIGSGGKIVLVSGYRSYVEQTQIYESSLVENGEDFTKKFVALPGCSEHQTGLAIDLAMNQEVIDFIRPDFPYDGICGEFRKLARSLASSNGIPRVKNRLQASLTSRGIFDMWDALMPRSSPQTT